MTTLGTGLWKAMLIDGAGSRASSKHIPADIRAPSDGQIAANEQSDIISKVSDLSFLCCDGAPMKYCVHQASLDIQLFKVRSRSRQYILL
ncbi:hypothetical protein E2P81_ATG07335 [Venturia nashicola]|nr:hypothetical protein E2P81_ATG07335 [Venturia nashicola]